MKTRTGEVTVWASRLEMACKSLAPAPEKWKGLADQEIRYRKRYVDLYATPETMRVFKLRSELVSRVRRYWDERDFMEVETPMLQSLAGGAAARPFKTHMNALDIDLFLRIAPELYLKRLIVGGLERVYEIGKDFRNEGVSFKHNPEFTMLEWYEAYADYEDTMARMERLVAQVSGQAPMVVEGSAAGAQTAFAKIQKLAATTHLQLSVCPWDRVGTDPAFRGAGAAAEAPDGMQAGLT
jgi:lysyl-tRNA synthetase class 2